MRKQIKNSKNHIFSKKLFKRGLQGYPLPSLPLHTPLSPRLLKIFLYRHVTRNRAATEVNKMTKSKKKKKKTLGRTPPFRRLTYSRLASRSNLAIASWNVVAALGCCLFVDEHVLDANLYFSANCGASWWQRCLLHLLSFAFSSTCSTWSFCKTVPFFHFLFCFTV